jgi:hypothetical protein
MKNNINSIYFKLILLLILVSQTISVSAQGLNNGLIRSGNGNQNSINNFGNLNQPFYYNGNNSAWYKLTYSNYALDYALAVGGDGNSEWNLSGTTAINPTMTNQTIDASGFTTTGAFTGYGTLISRGSISVGGQNFMIEQTYALPQNSAYLQIKVKVTNVSGTAATNVRVWVGTRDDWVGNSDQPTKTKGNLVNGAFAQIANVNEQSQAIKITSGQETVLVFSNSDRGYTISQQCCSFQNVINQNPTATGTGYYTNLNGDSWTGDGSYGFYVRMNDLAANESDDFTWYYAAGSLADIDDIISEVAQAAGAIQDITCTGATYEATSSQNGTGYYVAVPANSTPPNASQIKSGSNYGNVTVVNSGSNNMIADVSQTFAISGLNTGTDYDLYFVVEDQSQQFSDIIDQSFTTTTIPTAVISADGPTTFCFGDTVNLSTATGNELSYLWSNGSTTPSIEITQSGNYSVTISNDCGDSSTATVVNVVVNDSPDSTLSLSGPTTFCNGESVTMSVPVQAGATYLWTKDGIAISTASSQSYTASTSGLYMITVTSNGCSTISSQQVTGVIPPAISIDAAQTTIDFGDSITLTANVESSQEYLVPLASLVNVPNDCGGGSRYGNSNIGFSWIDQGNSVPTNIQIDMSFGVVCAANEVYSTAINNISGPSFSQSATPNCTCSAPPSENIKVINFANPTGYNIGGTNVFSITNISTATGFFPASSLAGNYAKITVTYGSGSSLGLTWSPAGETTPSITVSPTETTTYTVVGLDATGCSSETSLTINVTPPPITFSLVGTDTNCPGVSDGSITVSTTGASSDVEYAINNGAFSTSNVFSNLPSGNYSVQIQDGSYISLSQTISIGETPDTTLPNAIAKDIIIQLNANGNATINTNDINDGSFDPCGIQSYALNNTSFNCGNVGVNEVILTVTDNNGNVSTATANVTVEDNIAPEAIAQDITIQLDVNGVASIVPSDVDNGSNDACGITLALNQLDFDCSHVGANTVTLTVTDSNTNVSTIDAIVTVEDNIAPVAIAQNITIQLDVNGMASIVPSDIDNGSNDACGIQSYVLDETAFTCENVGVNVVTLTVTDNNGNVSTATANVTVEDSIAPVAIAQNITIQLDVNGVASIVPSDIDNGSNDACGIQSYVLDETAFTCENIGANTVTLTVTDNNANVSSVDAVVTVEDNIAPVAITQNITIQLDANGEASIVPSDVDNGSNDACGIASTMLNQLDFDCTHVGDNTVTLTVTDNNANVSTMDAVVTVEDNIAPTVITQNYSIDLANGVANITPSDIDGGTFDNCEFSLAIDRDAFSCDDIGNHTVTLTATDASGNTSSNTATVSILGDVPTIAINDFYAVQTQKVNTIFLGFGPQSINLSTEVTGGSGFTYQWTTSTGELVSNEANPSISPTVSTTYNVTVTNSNGCTATTSLYVCVIDARAFDKNGRYKGKVTVCHHTSGKKGTKHVEINISASAVMTHLTKHGYGTDHADSLGACDAVCVDNTNQRTIGDKVSATQEVSIEDNLLIYPNPSNGVFDIRLTAINLQTDVFLFDMTGKLIDRKSISEEVSAENIITIGNYSLANGFYLLKIITKNETIVKKLIVDKSN